MIVSMVTVFNAGPVQNRRGVRDSLGDLRIGEAERDIAWVGHLIRAPSASEWGRRPIVCP